MGRDTPQATGKIKSAKAPQSYGWSDLSTKDVTQINSWLNQGVTAFGIDCFKSDITVIDIDVNKGKIGASELVRMLSDLGMSEMPATLTATTGTGGTHYIYRDVEGHSQKSMGYKDIDVRSKGGLIVGHGSHILTADDFTAYKTYSFDVNPLHGMPTSIADLPKELADLMVKAAEKKGDAGTYPLPDSLDSEENVAKAITVIRTFGTHKNDPDDVDTDIACIVLVNKVGDYNISETKCEELLLEHYVGVTAADKGDDTYEWIAAKIKSGYSTRCEAIGCKTNEYREVQALAAFGSIHISSVEKEVNMVKATVTKKRGCEYFTDIDYLDMQYTKAGSLKLDVDQIDLMAYLRGHGFVKCKLTGMDTACLVRIKTGGATGAVIEETTEDEIRAFVISAIRNAPEILASKLITVERDTHNEAGERIGKQEVQELDELTRTIAENYIIRNVNSDIMLSDKKIAHLHELDVDLHMDTINASYFYFQNSVVQVMKDSIVLIDYKDLGGVVWASEVRDRDIKLVEGEGTFSKFCSLVSASDPIRVNALNCSLGYLMHRYKVGGLTDYCIVYSDQDSTDEQANGRSGKGILTEAVIKMRSTLEIDGKDKKFGSSNQFALAEYKLGQSLAVVDDLYKGYDFENMFTKITKGIKFERKYESAVSVPYAQSPKWAISTNYTLGNAGGNSARERRRDIEICNYFNGRDCTPKTEFGVFFWGDQYSDQEWDLFYNYMFKCSKEFLNAPEMMVPQVKFQALAEKNLAGATNYYFAQWCLNSPFPPFGQGDKLVSKTLIVEYTKYLETNAADDVNEEMKNLNKRIWRWVSEYANYLDLDLVESDKRHEGQRYREMIPRRKTPTNTK
tara:strand:- start:5 stop:2557 length:2553 start_codon:yes stop_codon:yes gene_type:complete